LCCLLCNDPPPHLCTGEAGSGSRHRWFGALTLLLAALAPLAFVSAPVVAERTAVRLKLCLLTSYYPACVHTLPLPLQGAKIGVLGANGAGKSSLMRILAGEDTSFDGRVVRAPGIRWERAELLAHWILWFLRCSAWRGCAGSRIRSPALSADCYHE
jgi:hypothetical protein